MRMRFNREGFPRTDIHATPVILETGGADTFSVQRLIQRKPALLTPVNVILAGGDTEATMCALFIIHHHTKGSQRERETAREQYPGK